MTTEEDKQQEESADQAQGDASPARKKTPRKKAAVASSAEGGRRRSSRAASGEAKKAKPRARPSRKAAAAEVEAEAAVSANGHMRPLPRMLERYRSEILPALMKELEYSSPMQAPRLRKIILNIGLGEALDNQRAMEAATRDLSLISGQRPYVRRARKSIAGFKLREGQAIGLAVTLRGRRMYEFYDRLVSSALPRIRDFHGVRRRSFDGRGNFSLGIREQVIFPEIEYDSIDKMRGLQVVVVTSAGSDREGMRLLELMGMPFERVGEEYRFAAA